MITIHHHVFASSMIKRAALHLTKWIQILQDCISRDRANSRSRRLHVQNRVTRQSGVTSLINPNASGYYVNYSNLPVSRDIVRHEGWEEDRTRELRSGLFIKRPKRCDASDGPSRLALALTPPERQPPISRKPNVAVLITAMLSSIMTYLVGFVVVVVINFSRWKFWAWIIILQFWNIREHPLYYSHHTHK